MRLHVFSHFNLLCKDARGRGRDHGAKRRNSSLSIIPLDYQRLRDLHPVLHPKIKVGCIFFEFLS